jgi:signal transduction histidine kinase
MRMLIEKLIVLARLERPEPSRLVRVDLASVARSTAAEIEAIPGHPQITLELDDGAHVMAEEADVHEALANLLDNARKYGEGSSIEVRVTREGKVVVADVIDAGPGIPEEEKAHVFERFYRGAARGEVEGSGLGLSIAQQAVSRAHGTLSLRESRPGRTAFEIRLPTAPHHDAPAPPAELVLG